MSRTTARPSAIGSTPGCVVEAVILDRDEGMLQVGGMSASGTSLPLLVHPEPGLAVGGEEPRVADAAAQLVDGLALAQHPGHGDGRHDHEGAEDDRGDPVAQRARNGDPSGITRGPRRTCSMNESTA